MERSNVVNQRSHCLVDQHPRTCCFGQATTHPQKHEVLAKRLTHPHPPSDKIPHPPSDIVAHVTPQPQSEKNAHKYVHSCHVTSLSSGTPTATIQRMRSETCCVTLPKFRQDKTKQKLTILVSKFKRGDAVTNNL